MSRVSFSPVEPYRVPISVSVVGACLLAGLAVWFNVVGRTDRVIYLGATEADAPGAMRLAVQPDRNYVMPPGPLLTSLRRGCRYDFSYPLSLVHRRGEAKAVRSATLIGCD
jgi:hypothetical protein